MKLASVRRSFTSAVSRAGLEGVTFHCLRKTGTDATLDTACTSETQKLLEVLAATLKSLSDEDRARLAELLEEEEGS